MYIHQGTTFKRSHAIYSISADDQLVDQTVIFCEKIYVWGFFFFTLIFIYVDAEHFKSNNYPISKTFTGICIKPLVFVILCMCENNMILDSDLKINAYIKKDKNELFVNNKRSHVQQASIQIFPREGMGGYFWLSAVG